MIGLPAYKLNPVEEKHLSTLLVAFMHECPFYAHLMHSIGELRAVKHPELPTAATDGRRIYYNPDFLFAHKVPEQVFILAHEVDHLVCRHPERFEHYREQGNMRGQPWSHEFGNVCADLVINANLVDTGIGLANPDWLLDPDVSGQEIWEDVYLRKIKHAKTQPMPVFRDSGHRNALKGAKGDPAAAARGGSFDIIMAPAKDPATGAEDVPEEHEFKEAVARAHAVAKAMGKLPGHLQRLCEEILEPQVNWRDEIRLLLTGRIGARGETWARPNRRRLVLNPLVVIPGKRGYGAELIVVAADTSGSIGNDEMAVFFAEINGILTDIKPRRIVVIGCDHRVSQVDEVASLDEFEGLRQKGIKGGGGTSFIPVFERVAEDQLKPEALVYLTDMCGDFPEEAPGYPVIWASTTDIEQPWGDRVRIKVEGVS